MANEDVERALMEALGMGQRPRSRPEGMGSRIPPVGRGMGESGKTISDADKLKMMMMKMGESGKTISDADRAGADRQRGIGEAGKTLSDSDMKMLELMMKQQQGVRDKAERKAFPPASMMNRGGEVKRKKKPKMGAVMKGRGGSYKGIK